jgi:hypothetical protein
MILLRRESLLLSLIHYHVVRRGLVEEDFMQLRRTLLFVRHQQNLQCLPVSLKRRRITV